MKQVEITRPKRIVIFCLLLTMVSAACNRRSSVAVIAVSDLNSIHVKVAKDEISSLKDFSGVEVRNAESQNIAFDKPGSDVMLATQVVKLPNLVGVIGHGDSRSSLMTAPIYNESRILQIVPTGTSRLLKDAGQWTFMMAPDDLAEGAFIGDFVVGKLRAFSVTIFYQLDEYGQGLRDGVIKSLASSQVRIIDQVAFDWLHSPVSALPEFDFPSLIAASLRRGKPDVAIIAGRSREAGEIVRILHKQTPETRFVCADGVQAEPIFLDSAKLALNLCYLVVFWHYESKDEVSRAYVERFRRIHGRIPFAGEAMTHDAIMVLAKAARDVGPNRSAIRKYLSELGVTRPAYHGVTGMISFTRDRPARLSMVQARNGVPVLVETIKSD